MQVVIKPSKLQGRVRVPSSKSMMQRAYAAALLHQGKTVIRNVGYSDDDKAAKSIVEQLGAQVQPISDTTHEVISNGQPTCNGKLSCGESGLSARMFTIIAALCERELTITGSGSLLQRSMQPFKPILEQLDVEVIDFKGALPITLKGPLRIKDINIDGSMSSQYLTGLLIAFAFRATEKTRISVNGLVSKPYIDLTLEVLSSFGKEVVHHNYQEFIIDPYKHEEKKEVIIEVEADWSSAAYWLVANELGNDIAVEGLYLKSTQADRRVIDVINNNEQKGFSFDATHAPDLFPILSIYAAYCNGESSIKGLHRLKGKESNRAETIQEMLAIFEVPFEVVGDVLVIEGGHPLKGGVVDSCNDHRIAMAAAIGALQAEGETTIINAEAVAKSYPRFFDDLITLGVNCTIINTP